MNLVVVATVGAMAGAFVGALVVSICVAARRGDDQAERDEASRN